MADSLLLKWGTLKGWDLESASAIEALNRLGELGPRSMSVAMQRDDDAQKAALCELIDAIDGTIQNDWSGEFMTKDEAKAYVLEYGQAK